MFSISESIELCVWYSNENFPQEKVFRSLKKMSPNQRGNFSMADEDSQVRFFFLLKFRKRGE